MSSKAHNFKQNSQAGTHKESNALFTYKVFSHLEQRHKARD